MPSKKKEKTDLEVATAAYVAAVGDPSVRLSMVQVFSLLVDGDDDQAATQYAQLSASTKTLFGDALTRLDALVSSQGGGGGGGNPHAKSSDAPGITGVK